MKGKRCFLHALGLVNALGSGLAEIRPRLLAADGSGMRVEDGWLVGGPACVGRVSAELPAIPERLARHHDTRNNRLLMAAAGQICVELDGVLARFGHGRVGAVIGSSTSGIAEGEAAVAHLEATGTFPAGFCYQRQEIGAPGTFLAEWLGLGGPAYTISTACTSSAKVFGAARVLLAMGVCDVVIAGGADSLCRFTVNGFSALEATSPERCNPFSANRRGINIGEGAALFLVTRDEGPVELLGTSESSDAWHMSAPDPEGRGAELAMRSALVDAGLDPGDVDYINLHGTATAKNDEMESRATHRVFGAHVPCSSTKQLTGHTLGAAGAIEAGFCWMVLRTDESLSPLPPHVWDGVADAGLAPIRLATIGDRLPPRGRRVTMSNSFAFGGDNVSVILGDPR